MSLGDPEYAVEWWYIPLGIIALIIIYGVIGQTSCGFLLYPPGEWPIN